MEKDKPIKQEESKSNSLSRALTEAEKESLRRKAREAIEYIKNKRLLEK